MKIEFEDKSYIEIIKSNEPNKVLITIAARDIKNNLSLISNSVEITLEQFNDLIKI